MVKVKNDILKLVGKLGDLTFYRKNGETIGRPAHSRQPRRMTRKQFQLRQRLIHNNALWRKLEATKRVYFEGGFSPCHRFRSINKEVPDVYMTNYQRFFHAALLLPNMVLSDGPLQPINYRLGEVEGQPAFITDLTPQEAQQGELLLYALRQRIVKDRDHEFAQLDIKVETIASDQFVNVPAAMMPFESTGDGLALVSDRFADPMMGFGLVHVVDGHVAHQRVKTNCTYYERFSTDEALKLAAKDYKGLTD